jgi:hypothetical protein
MAWYNIKGTGGTQWYFWTQAPFSQGAARRVLGIPGNIRITSTKQVNPGAVPSNIRGMVSGPEGKAFKPPAKKKARKKAPVWKDPNVASKKIIEDTYKKELQRYKALVERFGEDPFSIDEALAEQFRLQAAEDIDPYYRQTREDFEQGIETRRRRGLEDERNVLDELRSDVESFTGRTRRELDRALNASAEGFAESGMFFSGRRARERGLLEAESGIEQREFLGEAGRREARVKRLTARELEDITQDKRIGLRDVERRRTVDIEQEIDDLRDVELRKRGFEYATVPGPAPGVKAQDLFDVSLQHLIRGV